jgi:PKD repeat protein
MNIKWTNGAARLLKIQRVGFLALALLSALGSTAQAQDSVIVTSARFSPGDLNQSLGIRLVSTVPLTGVSVPLELRSLTTGAFVTRLYMTYSERLTDPIILPFAQRSQFGDRDPAAPSCPYDFANFQDGDPHPVAASPEGALFDRKSSGDPADTVPRGSDSFGSMILGFDLTDVPGRFEVDTVCANPDGTPIHFGLFTGPGFTPRPAVFIKGVVTINSSPVVRDTTLTIFVNTVYNGFLPGSDADGDPLKYQLESLPASGLAGIDNSNTGAFHYAASSTPGISQFQYSANDGLVTSNIATVTFNVLPPPPDTFHVETTGNDLTGDGTPAHPFASVAKALSVTTYGDVVLVGPGTYQAPPILVPGTAKLVSESGPFVTTLLGDGTGSVVVVDFGNDIDSARIEGFTIRDNAVQAGCTYCAGGVTVKDPSRVAIVNCIIRGNTGLSTAGGVEFAGPGTIANNWIFGNNGGSSIVSSGGITVASTSGAVIVGNTIAENVGPFNASLPSGVLFMDGNNINRCDNNIIVGNSPGPGLGSSVAVAAKPFYNTLYFGNGGLPINIPNPNLHNWVFANPQCRDQPAKDYHLTCGSPARGAANLGSVPSGVVLDIDRQFLPPISGNPDIGADQFYDEDKHAAFVPSAAEGCAPQNVSFTNQSTCIDEDWRWSFGDGGTSTLKNPSHLYLSAGAYPVRLIALGAYDSDTTYDTIRVVPPIVADFSANNPSGCVPYQVTLTAQANTPVDSFAWDFGDGQVGSGPIVSHTYTTVGTRTVRLDATNACGTVSVTKTDYISVNTLPVVQITSSFDTVVAAACSPFQVSFGYTSDRPIVAWNWDFGDDARSTDSTPVHVYAVGDTFSVHLIATGQCGAVSVVNEKYIKLVARPHVTASASPSLVCGATIPVNLQATVSEAFISATWFFGDGGSAAGVQASHIYSTVGHYLPRIVVVSSCGIDTVHVADSITVASMPVSAFAASIDSGYEPLNVQLTDQTSNFPTQWDWRFGDQGTSTAQNPAHIYSSGLYDATLISSNLCGADTSAPRRIVIGSYRSSFVDSLGTIGDTILYSVRIDTSVLAYDHTVHLSTRLTTLPLRGSMNFIISPRSGVPPFSAVLKAVPSVDLASATYTIELKATDSLRAATGGQPLAKTATRSLAYSGRSVIEVAPTPLIADSTIVGSVSTVSLTIRNTSSALQAVPLSVQAASVSGPPFEVVSGSAANLNAGQQVAWLIGFRPARKGNFAGTVRVRSNDPGNPDLLVPISGRGIGEQIPPQVTVFSPVANSEALIDQIVSFTFSEPLVVVPLDTILSIQSRREGGPVVGHASFTPTALTFDPTGWFWPDDTITVRLRAAVTDTNGNRLDGNGDGNEQGPPDDDYVAVFTTGPGVYPGDANRDGAVNEGDIIPLGRYWKQTGPARPRAYTDFSMQPAYAFSNRPATHADADGNGIVDSADICPIAQFFDQDTALPKEAVQSWLTEAESWSAPVVDALLGALVNCPTQTAGTATLKRILEDLRQSAPVPYEYSLSQNYPNPFNPSTVIPYSLGEDSHVTLEIYDILGRRLIALVNERVPAGRHFAAWDGRDDNGGQVASGIYFYRLQAGAYTQTRKMLLLK